MPASTTVFLKAWPIRLYPVPGDTLLEFVSDAGEAVFAPCGPTGDSWDVVSREAHLPADIGPGDKLVFHNTGAYNLVMVGRFNGFPKPEVHFI